MDRQAQQSARVLVAVGNTDAADSLEVLLHLLGHEVIVTYDGGSAFEAALRVKPDVAILDVHRPSMKGAEVARRLRSTPRRHSVFLVASLAAWAPEPLDRRLAEHENVFDASLTMPYSVDDLQSILTKVCTRATCGSPRRTYQPQGSSVPQLPPLRGDRRAVLFTPWSAWPRTRGCWSVRPVRARACP
jgi:CheY-like chemotaxis protein